MPPHFWNIDQVNFSNYLLERLCLLFCFLQIRNESAEDFLDLLKEWNKLCKRYVVKDVQKSPTVNSKVLRTAELNSKTSNKIPSGEFEVASLIDICYGDPTNSGKRGLKFQVSVPDH